MKINFFLFLKELYVLFFFSFLYRQAWTLVYTNSPGSHIKKKSNFSLRWCLSVSAPISEKTQTLTDETDQVNKSGQKFSQRAWAITWPLKHTHGHSQPHTTILPHANHLMSGRNLFLSEDGQWPAWQFLIGSRTLSPGYVSCHPSQDLSKANIAAIWC